MTSVNEDFLKKVFSEVPTTYERVNHVLTLGLDRVWRLRAARIAARFGEAGRWVDMCTGTAETAAYLMSLAPAGTRIQAVDFSQAMMAEARKKPEAAHVEFISADIHALPFPDGSVDLVTMSFAARNINIDRESLAHAFTELHRVLKRGGCFVNLETSQPPSVFVRRCFHLYVKLFVEKIGGWLSGSRKGYAYLAGTIPRFYTAETLADILRQAGFEDVTFRRLMFGAAAIHQARKG